MSVIIVSYIENGNVATKSFSSLAEAYKWCNTENVYDIVGVTEK